MFHRILYAKMWHLTTAIIININEECHMVLFILSLWKSCLPFKITFLLWSTARLKCNFGSQIVLDFFLYDKRATSATNHQNMPQHELNCSLLSVIAETQYVFLTFLGRINGILIRGGSRTAATSKIERFLIIVNGFQLLSQSAWSWMLQQS